MKKTLVAVLASLAILSTFIGCGSTPKEEGPKMDTSISSKIIDHQMKKFGVTTVPDWVISVATGRTDESVLKAAMPELSELRLFVVQNDAKDLQFAKKWAKEVELNAEVAKQLENNISTAATATYKGSQGLEEDTQSNQDIESVIRNLSTVTLKGLQVKAEYWIRNQNYDEVTGKNVGEPYYTYFLVAGIAEKDFEAQMKESMKNIENTATASEDLKKIIINTINDQYLGGNEVAADEE